MKRKGVVGYVHACNPVQQFLLFSLFFARLLNHDKDLSKEVKMSAFNNTPSVNFVL